MKLIQGCALSLILLSNFTNSFASIYKCETNGKINYSDQPCHNQSKLIKKLDAKNNKFTQPSENQHSASDLKSNENNKPLNKNTNIRQQAPKNNNQLKIITKKNSNNARTKKRAPLSSLSEKEQKFVKKFMGMGKKPLHPILIAAKSGDFKKIKSLTNKSTLNEKNGHGATALHIAATEGHVDIVNYLISKDADIHQVNRHGGSPLILACQRGHLPVIRALVENGANINEQTKKGSVTPLMKAMGSKNYDAVRYLIDKGADVDLRPKMSLGVLGNTTLPFDLYKEIAHRSKANINSVFLMGHPSSPIHMAAYRGDLEKLKFLISLGANINLKGAHGSTPALDAAMRNRVDVLDFLLKKGVDVNYTDKYGRTALIIASRFGNYEAVQTLLKYKPNLEIRTDKGLSFQHKNKGVEVVPRSAIEWAALQKHTHIVNLLKVNGAIFNES